MTEQPMALLEEVTSRGVVLMAVGDRLRYKPESAVAGELLDRLRCHKARLIAILLVRQVLAAGVRLTGRELLEATGLDRQRLYAGLGELYDWQEIRTDASGLYWQHPTEVN